MVVGPCFYSAMDGGFLIGRCILFGRVCVVGGPDGRQRGMDLVCPRSRRRTPRARTKDRRTTSRRAASHVAIARVILPSEYSPKRTKTRKKILPFAYLLGTCPLYNASEVYQSTAVFVIIVARPTCEGSLSLVASFLKCIQADVACHCPPNKSNNC